MNNKQYYTAPSSEIFNDIKQGAIKLWRIYGNQDDYAARKVNQIKALENIRDNTCYIVAMFDRPHQIKLLLHITEETQEWLQDLLFNNQTEK